MILSDHSRLNVLILCKILTFRPWEHFTRTDLLLWARSTNTHTYFSVWFVGNTFSDNLNSWQFMQDIKQLGSPRWLKKDLVSISQFYMPFYSIWSRMFFSFNRKGLQRKTMLLFLHSIIQENVSLNKRLKHMCVFFLSLKKKEKSRSS